MEYDGRDSVSDIHRGHSRVMEEGRATTTNTRVAGPYYAVPLFGKTGDSSASMSILLCDICGICGWYPLFLRGCCPCQMVHYCDGDTENEQLDSSGVFIV